MALATGESTLVSAGKGRTTCGYFTYPKGEKIIYATTGLADVECPPKPDYSKGYVWPVYSTFDIVEADPDGSNVKRLTTEARYPPHSTWCHKAQQPIFTSMPLGALHLHDWA